MDLRNADTITLGTYQFVFSDSSSDEPNVRAGRIKRRRAQEVTQLEDPNDIEEPAPAADVPLLVLKYNDVELQRFPLEDNCLIGRAKDCGIQIAERRLSRRHCQISTEGDRIYLKDLSSQNGTYVNRRKIRGSYELNDGDVLNFAEYSIHYLSKVSEYDGPDRVHAPGKIISAPAVSTEMEREETEFPEAYAEQHGYEDVAQPSIVPDDVVHPSDLEDEVEYPDPPVRANIHREPIVEEPGLARDRRKRVKQRVIKERHTPQKAPNPPKNHVPKNAAPKNSTRSRVRVEALNPLPSAPSPRRKPPDDAPTKRPTAESRRSAKAVHQDIEDPIEEVRPDPSLDDWFAARDDLDDEEPSVLLERSKSSMSQILSTMMVDKRELDKNLAVRAKQRRFMVDVSWGDERTYSGPLKEQVTILGTDQEADIKLKGRYVAGRHSLLVRVKDSMLLVRLGSSSAARVNGLPKLQAFLKSGDVIQIDETTIKITEE